MRATLNFGGVAGMLVMVVGACSGGGQGPDPTTPAKALSAVASSPRPTAPFPTPGERWLAFEDSTLRIRLVRLDGTGEHPLDTRTQGAQDNPDWSPDGTRLTFVGAGTSTTGNAGLWVVNADGTGLTKVVECSDPCQYIDDPAWSPDGAEIMYSRMQPDARSGGRLESVDLNSGRTTTVLTGRPGDFFAGVRYSPNGEAVVLEWVHASAADYEDVTGVTIARVDLGKLPPVVTALTDPKLFAQTADWSPLGDLVVYAALPQVGDSGDDLFLIRTDGKGLRRLTTLAAAGGGALHPDFTNDGSAVVFLGADPVSGESSFMRVDLATGRVSSAFLAGSFTGSHPRSRPVSGAG